MATFNGEAEDLQKLKEDLLAERPIGFAAVRPDEVLMWDIVTSYQGPAWERVLVEGTFEQVVDFACKMMEIQLSVPGEVKIEKRWVERLSQPQPATF